MPPRVRLADDVAAGSRRRQQWRLIGWALAIALAAGFGVIVAYLNAGR